MCANSRDASRCVQARYSLLRQAFRLLRISSSPPKIALERVLFFVQEKKKRFPTIKLWAHHVCELFDWRFALRTSPPLAITPSVPLATNLFFSAKAVQTVGLLFYWQSTMLAFVDLTTKKVGIYATALAGDLRSKEMFIALQWLTSSSPREQSWNPQDCFYFWQLFFGKTETFFHNQ